MACLFPDMARNRVYCLRFHWYLDKRSMSFKTADLVDEFDSELRFCNLPFRKYGRHRSFWGEVQTVKCFEDNALLKEELQKPGRGRVLVVDAGGSTRVAMVGDIIAGLAIASGWAGIVINGCIRDSEEIDAMEIGLRCLGTSPKKSVKDGAGKVGLAVAFGGVEFNQGDYVYCDADGVVISARKLLD